MFLLRIHEPEAGSTSPIIELEYHIGEIPPYAILSHRWGLPTDEVTFQDMMGNIQLAKRKKGYAKVESCCLQALEYGLNYAWIDTCCIDKSSSAELSEAINSMWSWYRDARICFAYLNDVSYDSASTLSEPSSQFCRSAWFDRGWTLQELIAPLDVIFFAADWGHRSLGDKYGLAEVISSITGIRKDILQDRSLVLSASIAERMSWASQRRTTRVEDEAYSLLGIFGVNMATIYGEGSKAFIRLQEEILRTSTDQTIFAWSGEGDALGMLAKSPRNFMKSANYVPLEFNDFSTWFQQEESTDIIGSANMAYSMTNFGLQISLPVVTMPEKFQEYCLAFLACTYGTGGESTIIFLKHRAGRPKNHFHRVSFSGKSITNRPIPKSGYPVGLCSKLSWICGADASAKLILQPSLNSTPPCRFISLHIRSDAGPLNSRKVNPNMFRETFDAHPPALWHNTNDYTCARFSSGEHVAVIIGQTKALGVAFALGLHDGQIWYSFKSDVQFQPAETIYEEYDLFNFGAEWKSSPSYIKFFKIGWQREWDTGQRGPLSGGHQTLYRQNPTFTDNGDLCEAFEMVFYHNRA